MRSLNFLSSLPFFPTFRLSDFPTTFPGLPFFRTFRHSDFPTTFPGLPFFPTSQLSDFPTTLKSTLPLIFLVMLSCGKREEKREASTHQHSTATSNNDTGKAVNHQNHSPQEHDMENMNTEPESEEILQLDKYQVIKANIHTALAEVKSINEGLRLLGTVASDERKTEVISAKIPGRITKLFVNKPQTLVHKGQALFGIYSEQLYNDINDYLTSLSQKDSVADNALIQKLIGGAKQRLVLSGITEKQLNTIKSTRKIPPYLIYYSPATGFISDLLIREGQYVETGMPLFKVTDLSTVWIETQVYPGEIRLVNSNASVNVEFEAYPAKVYSGTIVFTNPTFETNRKINLIRIKINNEGYLIKPGMMAYINILRKNKRTLVIPKNALIIQKMTMVWVQTKEGVFERRMVSTGIENKKEIEILSGLQEGERVVTTGSYLLNSEYILQKGSNAMAGMEM